MQYITIPAAQTAAFKSLIAELAQSNPGLIVNEVVSLGMTATFLSNASTDEIAQVTSQITGATSRTVEGRVI